MAEGERERRAWSWRTPKITWIIKTNVRHLSSMFQPERFKSRVGAEIISPVPRALPLCHWVRASPRTNAIEIFGVPCKSLTLWSAARIGSFYPKPRCWHGIRRVAVQHGTFIARPNLYSVSWPSLVENTAGTDFSFDIRHWGCRPLRVQAGEKNIENVRNEKAIQHIDACLL